MVRSCCGFFLILFLGKLTTKIWCLPYMVLSRFCVVFFSFWDSFAMGKLFSFFVVGFVVGVAGRSVLSDGRWCGFVGRDRRNITGLR